MTRLLGPRRRMTRSFLKGKNSGGGSLKIRSDENPPGIYNFCTYPMSEDEEWVCLLLSRCFIFTTHK